VLTHVVADDPGSVLYVGVMSVRNPSVSRLVASYFI
jgi:hypothetical protein